MKISSILFLIAVICTIGLIIFSNTDTGDTDLKCGTVTYKPAFRSEENRYSLYVKYEKGGEEVQEYVDVKTYETKSVNDNVCFKDDSEQNFIPLIFAFGAAIFLLLSLITRLEEN